MPSHFSGFYIPFLAQESGENQYGYDIDIDNRVKAQEETKYTLGSPKRKDLTEESSEEDEIAELVIDHRSISRSPVNLQRSKERQVNGSFHQKSINISNQGNNGIVPVVNMYPKYENRLSYGERNSKLNALNSNRQKKRTSSG